MKLYLILAGVFGAAVAQAQTSPASVKQVSTAPGSGSRQAIPAKGFAPRQLSLEEKAELRRQLYQYSRLKGKARGGQHSLDQELGSQAYAKE